MNDQQLQLALVKMLPPGTIECGEYYTDPNTKTPTGKFWFHWPDEIHECRNVKDTEWLHLCWLVEQTIPDDDWMHYASSLGCVSASWKQRAEALCKVKGITI